jgi:hypothetical protein
MKEGKMTWMELKNQIIDLLDSRNLKQPSRRKSALNNIENWLRQRHPDIVTNPELILDYDKNQFIGLLELCKTSRLNDAEKSIVNNIYEFLG